MDIDWCVSKFDEQNGLESSHIKQWHILKLLQHLSDIEVKHMDAMELRKKDIEVEINHIASMAHKALQSSKICH